MNIVRAAAFFNELLAYNEFLKTQQERELCSLPPGKLGIRSTGRGDGSVQYCHYVNGKRLGITKNPSLVKALARKKYLETSLIKVEDNIKALKKLMKQYEDIDPQSIISEFPTEYAVLLDEASAMWKDKKNLWMAEKYEKSTYRSWEKNHVTASGLKVRSKSEVIIAERLDFYGIPYRYEQMLYIERYSFAPDFTILTTNGLKYWEHAGCVNDMDYIHKHNWKISMYAKIGIVPWKNLIVTYDDEEGRFDSRIIESEIVNRLLPYC